MNKLTHSAARVQKLENSGGDDKDSRVIVDWDDTPDSELPPGTLVIEWAQNGEIISHRVKREGQPTSPHNAKKRRKSGDKQA